MECRWTRISGNFQSVEDDRVVLIIEKDENFIKLQKKEKSGQLSLGVW